MHNATTMLRVRDAFTRVAEVDGAFAGYCYVAFYERQGWSRDGAEKVHPRAQAVAVRLQRAVA